MRRVRKLLRGTSWYLDWGHGPDRKKVSLGQITKREAELHRAAKEVALATGIVATNLPRSTSTLNHFVEKYLNWREAVYPSSQPRVQGIFTKHLLPAFGHLSLQEITPARWDQYSARRIKSKTASATIKKEYDTIRACLNKAEEWGELRKNPLRFAKPPTNRKSKPPRFFTKEELQAIYQANADAAPIWKLMANTGMRRGEAQHLRWEHIVDGYIHILSEEDATTKSGKWRRVPINDAAKDAIEALRTKHHTYVIPPMVPSALSHKFSKTLKKANLTGSLHALRHTFCTHLAQAGVPVRVIKELAGHSTIAVTEKYLQLVAGSDTSAVSNICL